MIGALRHACPGSRAAAFVLSGLQTMTNEVKSAVRVIQILEYFDTVRREAGVLEISRALGFPASSTAGILRSLQRLSYLVQDEQRLYRPTPRVTLLGSWIDPLLAHDGPLMALMSHLSKQRAKPSSWPCKWMPAPATSTSFPRRSAYACMSTSETYALC